MKDSYTRRNVLKIAGASTLGYACNAQAAENESTKVSKLTIGLVADVHQDTIHDGFTRMRYFIDEMKKRKPDMLLQLGDFAVPRPRNQPFLDTWNEFEGPRYHVLGNHDMDHKFTKEQTMKWWGMKERYYSFDQHGWHFIVLDGNKPGAPWIGQIQKDQ